MRADRERWRVPATIDAAINISTRHGKQADATRYYILSRRLVAQELVDAVRGRWGSRIRSTGDSTRPSARTPAASARAWPTPTPASSAAPRWACSRARLPRRKRLVAA